MDVKSAIALLRKDAKKRKFDQTFDLVVNLKNFDVRKEALNTFIPIPHGVPKKLAGFFAKRSKLVDTITEEDFVKYKDVKSVKRLAKSYDAFMASAPMMGKVATTFGRVFGPMGKMPSPQAGIVPKQDESLVSEMVSRMNSVVRVRNKELAIKLKAGKESMSDDHLVANVVSMVKSLESKLPRGRDNIKEVLVKFTMSKPVKVEEVK